MAPATAAMTPRSLWQRSLMHPGAKALVFVACLAPLALLIWGAVQNTLGANPAEALIRQTGLWTLRLLCLTLLVTPLRQLTGWAALARFRRMLGLFTFFYASVHLLAYAWLDMGLYLQDLALDIARRPFILVGFLTWLLLLPLALTSFNRAIRWLGARRWQWLHRLVYLCAALAILHFLWVRAGKNDFADVYLYGAFVAALLLWRVVRPWLARRPAAASAGAS